MKCLVCRFLNKDTLYCSHLKHGLNNAIAMTHHSKYCNVENRKDDEKQVCIVLGVIAIGLVIAMIVGVIVSDKI